MMEWKPIETAPKRVNVIAWRKDAAGPFLAAFGTAHDLTGWEDADDETETWWARQDLTCRAISTA